MRNLIAFIILLTWLEMPAQEPFTEDNAKAIIDVFFDGFHEGDTIKMRSVLAPVVGMQSVHSNDEGKNFVRNSDMNHFIMSIAKRPTTQIWKEILLDYKVQIDGNLAHVWTPYRFELNGVFSHCGANAFTLVKTDNGWKIIHLIDSRRKASCKEE